MSWCSSWWIWFLLCLLLWATISIGIVIYYYVIVNIKFIVNIYYTYFDTSFWIQGLLIDDIRHHTGDMNELIEVVTWADYLTLWHSLISFRSLPLWRRFGLLLRLLNKLLLLSCLELTLCVLRNIICSPRWFKHLLKYLILILHQLLLLL